MALPSCLRIRLIALVNKTLNYGVCFCEIVFYFEIVFFKLNVLMSLSHRKILSLFINSLGLSEWFFLGINSLSFSKTPRRRILIFRSWRGQLFKGIVLLLLSCFICFPPLTCILIFLWLVVIIHDENQFEIERETKN